MAKQPTKRSLKNASTGRKGAKRQRCNDDVQPMDIDDEKIRARSSKTSSSSSAVVPSSAAPQVTTRAAAARAAQQQQQSPQQHVSFPSRFVPEIPPTVSEVEYKLSNQQQTKTPTSRKKKQVTPKAPPPSPYTPKRNQQQKAPKLSDTTVRRILDLPTEKDSPKTKSVACTLWIPLLIVLMIPAVLIPMTTTFLPKSRQPTRPFEFKEERGPQYAKRPSFWLRSSSKAPPRLYKHIIPPAHVTAASNHHDYLSDLTLRDFLQDPSGIHLAMAPAFFGFYAYFGVLAAWNEDLPVLENNTTKLYLNSRILSVAGGSAGAMAAVLIAAGICPKRAAQYCASLTLSKFADPPGWGGVFKGDLFEQLMKDFITDESGKHTALLEQAHIPVAVSAFDIKSLKGKIIHKGCMAKAARASATFPLLFQPVHWPHHENDDEKSSFSFIDGGVTDGLGLQGLSVLMPEESNKRIVNLVVGGEFPGMGTKGPSDMPEGIQASEVLSVSVRNTPLCGPWAMSNGPRAVEASRLAMKASLDIPLYKGKEPRHYELHIDASDFVPPSAE